MNFFSSALSLLSTSSIPYAIKEKIALTGDIWSMYNGTNPKTDSPVTIFEFNLKDPANAHHVALARNCFKKLKLIKLPEVISIVDFIENESFLYIVTELVVPLVTYLQQDRAPSTDAKAYGLFRIATALAFIHTKANCVHGNLTWSSVYVNNQGEWKLFGFEVLTNLTSDPDQPLYRLSGNLGSFRDCIPPEVASKGVQAVQTAPTLLDSFKLGIFILQLFATTNFHNLAAIGADKLPALLRNAFVERLGLPKPLVPPTVAPLGKERTSTKKFLSDALRLFFDSCPLVQFSRALEEIKFTNSAAKLSFFKHDLAQYIECELPPGFVDHKVIPELVDQFNVLMSKRSQQPPSPEEHVSRQEAMATILNHILTLSVNLSDALFTKLVAPVVFAAFTLPDRTIRISLLKHLASYASRLLEPDVLNKMFPNLLTGFQDTNFLIRETTLTSMTLIIDKVSVKQINNDLLKVLAKLQMDPKPSIRTNTLILIIKIADSIYSTSRNNVMITALSKALRDSFTPCKLAALSGFEKLIDNFGLEEKCTKVLGQIAIALIDPKSHKVRVEAKRVLQRYLDAVERSADNFSNDEEDEDAEERDFMQRVSDPGIATPKPGSQPAQPSFGWGMINKLVLSEPSDVSGEIHPALNRSNPDLTRNSSAAEESWTEDIEDDWGADAAVSVPDFKFVSRAKPKTLVAKRAPLKKEPAKKGGLKLGATLRTPGLTLKLDLKVEDDDGWGSLW